MIVEAACPTARKWLRTQPDAQTAWDACTNPSWMLWWCDRCGVDPKTRRLLAVKFARSVQHLLPDSRIVKGIDVAERYAKGEATDEERDAARIAARDVWNSANLDVHGWSEATEAAYEVVYATLRATPSPAWAAGAAREASGGDPAVVRTQCALIREIIPVVPIKPKG